MLRFCILSVLNIFPGTVMPSLYHPDIWDLVSVNWNSLCKLCVCVCVCVRACVCFLFLLLLPLQDFALCVVVLYFLDIHSALLKFCTLYLGEGDRVMLWLDWPWTHYEALAGLELVLLLSQHPECWITGKCQHIQLVSFVVLCILESFYCFILMPIGWFSVMSSVPVSLAKSFYILFCFFLWCPSLFLGYSSLFFYVCTFVSDSHWCINYTHTQFKKAFPSLVVSILLSWLAALLGLHKREKTPRSCLGIWLISPNDLVHSW
jgi:hypothetical protein